MNNDFSSIAEFARTSTAGRFNIIPVDSIDSSNRYAKLLLSEKKIGHNTVILADEQVQGKGRLNRSWASPPGVGLWMSIVVEPELPATQWFLFTFMSAVAVAEAIEHQSGLEVQLKWPNDVLIRRKKTCGILLESVSVDQKSFLIIGIGLNVNQPEFPDELLHKATSLAIEAGKEISRREIFVEILLRFSQHYSMLDISILRIWKKRTDFFRQPITIFELNQEFDAIALDVNDDGGLIVDVNGLRRTIYAGDVRIQWQQV
ncbi:biotin--[acetyl-CoA-carboxylase] ligase [bacterium]|nr:biotin--[acetyl-CoA-carboxylase] ligase [bacterium]